MCHKQCGPVWVKFLQTTWVWNKTRWNGDKWRKDGLNTDRAMALPKMPRQSYLKFRLGTYIPLIRGPLEWARHQRSSYSSTSRLGLHMNSSFVWEFSLCPFWINECILAWIPPVMPCQERMLPSFRSLHHYTRWWSIPQFSCENKEVCTLMHRKFLMGIQSVLTIYKNQVGGNLVHKHEKSKIWR